MPSLDSLRPPARRYDYVTDGQEIYRRSFATIRAEMTALAEQGRLPRWDAATTGVLARLAHAAGDVPVLDEVALHPGVIPAGREALAAGAPILCDSHMLASGITARRLPAGNEVICTLRDPGVPDLARAWGTTRSAAAVSLWGPWLKGAVVAVGNAPTALFHLLEMLADGAPRPAAIIGIPVGFIGSAESKDALAEHRLDDRLGAGGQVPWLIVRGRRGGSAMAAAVVNALADEDELA